MLKYTCMPIIYIGLYIEYWVVRNIFGIQKRRGNVRIYSYALVDYDPAKNTYVLAVYTYSIP